MADEDLLHRVHSLSDLELAQLLCLISRQHALISTVPDVLDDLVEELQLISTKTFGLECVVVDCTPHTTLDDFATSILLPSFLQPPAQPAAPIRPKNDSYFAQSGGRLAPLSPITATHPPILASSPRLGGSGSDNGSSSAQGQGQQPQHVANVILAKNLDRAPKAVQIQVLELLRTSRITMFSRGAVHVAPRPFLLLGVLAASSGGEARVGRHLNDFFFLAHWHDPADGFANLDEEDEDEEGDVGEDAETASTESVVKRSSSGGASPRIVEAVITQVDIAQLRSLSGRVQVDVDVLRYQMNVVSFLRLHRAVASGVTPTATKHLDTLARCLAPIHRLDFVTPALVGLAARKVYLHRLRVVTPGTERSVQWGSEVEAVRTLLEGVGAEDAIEDVLGMVTVPV